MRILIADDHHLIVEGLTRILLDVFPFSEIESVANADLLYKKSILEKWDIIITDICMPGSSVIDTIKQLKLNTPQTPILVLTMYAAEHYAVRCIRAGASGFVTKESSPYELIAAIKQILSGKKYFTQNVAEILADTMEEKYESLTHELLSDREFEVMKYISEVKSISEIGEILNLNINTVSTYRARVMEKMSFKNNAEIVKYCIEHKLIFL
jgi:DNA-binding NarL/FixJ family response regulator